jgi:flagellar basal-body rod protein FlgB
VFINRLINQGNIPLLEQSMKFAAARQEVLAENVANLSTPGYLQKDLDPAKFQAMLRERVEMRKGGPRGGTSFAGISEQEIRNPQAGILFHDGNNRTVEQLMADVGKNALKHNLYAELLRKQFSSIDMALKGQVA